MQVEQIIAEYKVLALQHHPDKNDGDKEAEAKFQQLKVRKKLQVFFLNRICISGAKENTRISGLLSNSPIHYFDYFKL